MQCDFGNLAFMKSQGGDKRKSSVTVYQRKEDATYSSSQSPKSFWSVIITVEIPITIIILQSSCFIIVGLDLKLAKTMAKKSRGLRGIFPDNILTICRESSPTLAGGKIEVAATRQHQKIKVANGRSAITNFCGIETL